MLANGLNGFWATLGFANHGNKAGLGQHHFGKFIHAGGGGGASGAHGFVTHGIYRTNVVNDAVGKVHGQFFAFGQHVLNALVGSVATSEHFAVEQQGIAGFPAGHFGFAQGVKVHALAFLRVGRPSHVGPKV